MSESPSTAEQHLAEILQWVQDAGDEGLPKDELVSRAMSNLRVSTKDARDYINTLRFRGKVEVLTTGPRSHHPTSVRAVREGMRSN